MRLLISATALLLAAPLAGQAPSDPPPARIDSIFATVNRSDGPGCALGVYRAGTIIYSNGYGLANLEHRVRITPQTNFYIASTSKQFTAASIALLAEAGRLDLNSSVRRYVPELPAYADSVTVLDLVHHTGGIRDYLTLWGQAGKSFGNDIGEDEALASIVRQKSLDFKPGARWSYSNSGYFLLSVIVRRVTGKSLRQCSDSAIFKPLGMTSTHFHDDRMMVIPNRAEGYEPKGSGWAEHRTGYALVGDGGLHTTVEDLAKWDANFYDNKLGKGGPAFIEAITTPGKLSGNRPTNYAFGLMRQEYRGLPVVAHGGAFIGFRASLTRYPTRRLAVAILCNDYSVDTEALVARVADLYLAVPARPAVAGATLRKIEPSRLAAYAGRYELFPGVPVVLTSNDSTRAAEFMGRPPAAMARKSDSSFAFPLGKIELAFPRSPDGPAPELVMITPTGVDRVPRLADAPALSPSELLVYGGKYWSDELEVFYSIEVTNGKLVLHRPGGPGIELKVIAPEMFAANVGKLTFRRGPDGKVAGFKLGTSRSEGIEFVRKDG
jgi:CubicO group peptidase (beta-lactamase class C family)